METVGLGLDLDHQSIRWKNGSISLQYGFCLVLAQGHSSASLNTEQSPCTLADFKPLLPTLMWQGALPGLQGQTLERKGNVRKGKGIAVPAYRSSSNEQLPVSCLDFICQLEGETCAKFSAMDCGTLCECPNYLGIAAFRRARMHGPCLI
eukprot:132644-Pelagomonas_calceolata.AAC.3